MTFAKHNQCWSTDLVKSKTSTGAVQILCNHVGGGRGCKLKDDFRWLQKMMGGIDEKEGKEKKDLPKYLN